MGIALARVEQGPAIYRSNPSTTKHLAFACSVWGGGMPCAGHGISTGERAASVAETFGPQLIHQVSQPESVGMQLPPSWELFWAGIALLARD
jgi:hypothetical protein